jgi:arylsulfatase A-like enzyme
MAASARVAAAPNFVVFLTDDQRFDTLWAMPNVQSKLVARGVRFDRAYIQTPMCCPTRAAILSGGFFSKNTGVLMNPVPKPSDNGGVLRFNDRDTIALHLQAQGYQTMLLGKYLNGFYSRMPGYPRGYVPPGWSRFVALLSSAVKTDWYDMKFLVGSSGQQPSTGVIVGSGGRYVTDYQRDEALGFLNSVRNDPFFLYLAFNAPHAPAQPPVEDAALFPDYRYRGRGYGESDLSDKPVWVSDPNKHKWLKKPDDEHPRNQLRTLQSVDRAIGVIVDTLQQQGKLDKTVFIFASDNGYMWGEHGLFFGKGLAYEESIRVPFVVVMPGVAARTDRDSLVYADVDMSATIYDLAGVNRHVDGVSLVPLLRNRDAPWRSQLVVQNYGFRAGSAGAWGALITKDWKYIQHVGGGMELYNVANDPFELASLHADPAYRQVRDDLSTALQPELGLQITSFYPTRARVGQSYSFNMKVWGAAGTLTWREFLPAGAPSKLPPGIRLDATGRIYGTPTKSGSFQTTLEVEDSVLATQRGTPRRFVAPVTLRVSPP